VKLVDYKADMERCSQCSYCEFIPLDHVKSIRFSLGCPSAAYTKFGTYSARGRYGVAWSLLDGRSQYSEKVKEIVYECLLCGSCDVACKISPRYDLRPLDALRAFRAKLVEDGQTIPQHIAVITSLRNKNNILQKPKSERGKWAEGLDVKRIPEDKAEVLFFAGCRYSYDEELQKTARTAVNLLKNSDVDVGILGNAEMCCGDKIYDMGYQQDFNQVAEKNLKAWTRAGVKVIVTPCADCYHAFKRLYPPLGSHIEVFHCVEYLDRLIKTGKITFSKTLHLRVTYHDPCKLGRQGEPYIPWEGTKKKIRNQIEIYEPPRPFYNGNYGVYDPPRNILHAIPGIELVEMERIREYAWCCGAGGGVREAYPEFSSWTAMERIQEATSTGAEAIVTACPWCERNFIDAVNAANEKIKVFDIAELVQEAI
jgi:Fe-S oxidoreductase